MRKESWEGESLTTKTPQRSYEEKESVFLCFCRTMKQSVLVKYYNYKAICYV